MRANQEIRELAQFSGVFLWQVADKMGMADSNLSKKLRRELPENEKTKIKAIIAELGKREV